MKLRHGFVSPAIAVPPAPTFALGRLDRVLPAACAVGDETAHGFGGYARCRSPARTSLPAAAYLR
ncbi:MAG: hypothetical protein Q8O52_09465 [Sulfuritalea sp.]|nr:hypothetical protein [Sulfuritalea sp.]